MFESWVAPIFLAFLKIFPGLPVIPKLPITKKNKDEDTSKKLCELHKFINLLTAVDGHFRHCCSVAYRCMIGISTAVNMSVFNFL